MNSNGMVISMICSKCGQEVKSNKELEGLNIRQKVALFVSTQTVGTYAADVARKTGISRTTADFYLSKLALEKEIDHTNIGSWMMPRDMYYPYFLIKGLANYPDWNYETEQGLFKTKFRASIVQRFNGEKLLRIQQHLIINGYDNGISGICIPAEATGLFEDTLFMAIQQIK